VVGVLSDNTRTAGKFKEWYICEVGKGVARPREECGTATAMQVQFKRASENHWEISREAFAHCATVDAILHSRVKIETERPSIPRLRLTLTCQQLSWQNITRRWTGIVMCGSCWFC
jgi:hypothetical protein